jgi:3-oxo-5alpha-steroid 4-dehydrogenase
MVEKYCPKYLGLCPLGNLGDQGLGIQMALEVGAASGQMDRGSAWKFINPPSAFVKGILLDPTGRRVRNEDCYGATLSDVLVQRFDGRGWLLIDQVIVDEVMGSLDGLHADQSSVALANLFKNCEKSENLDDLAKTCGMTPDHVTKSVDEYNAGATRGEDAMGKQTEYLAELRAPPFTAINMDVRSRWWPTPMMTLGGLQVQDMTGAVLSSSGDVIPGLYAAGRTAVGVCSNSYVSGLSLADCLYGGRRAGRSVAVVQPKLQTATAARPIFNHSSLHAAATSDMASPIVPSKL